MSQRNKLISVITVNWNGKKWLKKYLNSVKNQTYKNIEIIVVDNASTDDSVEFISKFFPQVKIIKNKQNLGLAKATKIGITNSLGEYMLFINNDTWFNSDFIEKMHDFYIKNNYTVISAYEKRYFDDSAFLCNTTIDLTASPAYYIPAYSRPDKIFYLTVCFFCTKKDYLQTGGVDEDFFMYYEDVDWFWRLTLLGKKFAIAQDCFIHHAGAGSTGTGVKYKFFLWRNQNALRTLIKNYSTPMLIIILPIYLLQNIFEIIFFLFTLKPQVAFSYIEGWLYNVKNISETFRKRKWVQEHRVINDLEIIKKMYLFPAKFVNFIDYLSIKQ